MPGSVEQEWSGIKGGGEDFAASSGIFRTLQAGVSTLGVFMVE